MFTRARHRRSFGAMPTAADRRSPVRMLLFVCIGIMLVLWGGWRALQALGIFNQVQRASVQFTVLGGDVNVSLEGAELRRAGDAKLYADDRIVSNTGGRGQLSFFDGTLVSLEERTDVTILESERGTKESSVALRLEQGTAAVYVPVRSLSGAMVRMVRTAAYEAVVPAGTLATFSPRTVQVADSSELGVTVTTEEGGQSAYVGEGQKLALPEGEVTGSLYAHRTLIDPEHLRLLSGLRAQAEKSAPGGAVASTASGAAVAALAQDELTLSEPQHNALITAATVTVKGQAGPAVQRVRINGHDVKLDPESGAFSQELSVAKGESMNILAEALDVRDVTIAQQQRTVRLKAPELGKASFTAPAADGAVYRTNRGKFEIRGTAPAGAAGIVVNDYRLQLFKAGDAQWAYLANADLGNIAPGTNLFSVHAVDAQGNKGPAATMTIVYDPAGEEGLVTAGGGSSAGGAAASEPEQVDEGTLPKNAPLAPGSLSITAPTTGDPYSGAEEEILIEGLTSRDTDSVWVNGYKLRLYKPGATFWNYYARTQYGTLKKGANTYVVNARNAKGEILDTVTYVINH